MAEPGCSLAVVFDWDGTVFDSDFLIDLAIERVLEQHAPSELERLQPSFYLSRRPVSPLKMLRLPSTGREATIQAIAEELRTLEKRAAPFNGAQALIGHLRQLGIPLAILTRRDRASLTAQLRRCALEQAFTSIVCRGETQPKPDPAGLHLIRQQLQAERLILIGNSMDDMHCARQADTDFIAVRLCSRVRDEPFDSVDCNVLNNYKAVHDALVQTLHSTPSVISSTQS